jgi:serine phosphatase RsbU (regulator of sigma subunit)
MAALVTDVSEDERFADAESLLRAGVRTVLAAPLLDPEGSLGMIVLGSGERSRTFTGDDLELLVSLASAAALRIRNVALTLEAADRRRMAEEMASARAIQEGLLPGTLPAVAGWDLCAVNRPSAVVSGDLYSAVVRGEPGELVVMISDVAGKGLSASLVGASLEALCAGPVEAGFPPDETFARVTSRLLRRTPPEKFATAFLAALDPLTGRLRFANAGHLPSLVIASDGGHRWLRARGLPLGLLPSTDYELGETILAPGDLLVLYTDGFTEALNPAGEEFGEHRVLEVCLRAARLPLPEIVTALELKVTEFTHGAALSDDRTLLLLRRSPSGF